MEGWKEGWMAGKAGLRIAYSNQKCSKPIYLKANQILTAVLYSCNNLQYLKIFGPCLICRDVKNNEGENLLEQLDMTQSKS